jgi:hypothetical protein
MWQLFPHVKPPQFRSFEATRNVKHPFNVAGRWGSSKLPRRCILLSVNSSLRGRRA